MQGNIPSGHFVESKRLYKKIGTIFDHLVKCVNPFYYQIVTRVVSHYPLVVNIYITTIPTDIVQQPMVMNTLTWYEGNNHRLFINPVVLNQNADW
jgi:hypothetical protein